VQAAPPAYTPPPVPAATPVAPPAQPAPATPPLAAHDTALLAAFLRGAGMPGARVEDPAATMEALGSAFRALVSGLRAVLIARAAIKGEFRIEQTMIRARGNNPLKFSADDDDALSALLGTGRRTNMAPAEAVSEALRDLRLHELASVAAMQTAVRELLAQLSPGAAMAQAGSGGLLPMQKKARAFEAYEEQHAGLVRALSDDFDSAFGKAFARAYEEALREAAARPEER
jgi:type VI secretion system FHA domain protein